MAKQLAVIVVMLFNFLVGLLNNTGVLETEVR